MKEIEKQKNILDLKHQKYLNYLNIFVITILSSFVTIIIGTYGSWDFEELISYTLIVIVVLALFTGFFEYKLKQIKEEILNLK